MTQTVAVFFLDLSHKAREAKVNKWDLFKFKNFYITKVTKNKMKKRSVEWKKIFANKVTNKRFHLKYTNI